MADSSSPVEASFAAGGVTEKARARLGEAARRGDRFFQSTFTVGETAVACATGVRPLGTVMGSSIYHLGWTWQAFGGLGAGELTMLGQAHSEARRLALGRLHAEAQALGAHAVAGVQLTARKYEWSGDLFEFKAIGTAVAIEGGPPPATRAPALSTLTVQELYQLRLAGAWPAGIVMGNCVYYNPHADCAADGAWFNREMTARTQCLDEARRIATARFRQDVVALGAAGAVGVKVERHFESREWEANNNHHTSFKAELLLLGTAVVRTGAPAPPRPRLVLDLGDHQVDLGESQE